jgi:hypothetical protein
MRATASPLAVAPLKVAADCAWRPTLMEPRFAGAQWGARPKPRDGPFSIWRPPEADPKEKPQYEAAGFRRPTAGRNAGPSWVPPAPNSVAGSREQPWPILAVVGRRMQLFVII